MTTITLLLLLVINSAWMYACIALMLTRDQINEYLPFNFMKIQFEPSDFVAHAMVVAFASQLILLCAIYWITVRKNSLSNSYKKIKSERKKLLTENKEAEKVLVEQQKNLEKADTVEEQKLILEERSKGLDQLNSELRSQNTTLSAENEALHAQLDMLSAQNERLKEGKPSLSDNVKIFMSSFKKKD